MTRNGVFPPRGFEPGLWVGSVISGAAVILVFWMAYTDTTATMPGALNALMPLPLLLLGLFLGFFGLALGTRMWRFQQELTRGGLVDGARRAAHRPEP